MNDAMALIESLELPYLEALQRRLAEHIEQRRRADRAEAVEQIRRIAASVGMRVEDILALGAKGERKPYLGKGQAKYRHPDGRTWNGFGRMPGWLAASDNPEQYRV
jgi:DNA-binding protein H-NS